MKLLKRSLCLFLAVLMLLSMSNMALADERVANNLKGIVFVKDQNGDPVPGVVLQLQHRSRATPSSAWGTWGNIGDFSTDANGVATYLKTWVSINSLHAIQTGGAGEPYKCNSYRVVITSAPSGYDSSNPSYSDFGGEMTTGDATVQNIMFINGGFMSPSLSSNQGAYFTMRITIQNNNIHHTVTFKVEGTDYDVQNVLEGSTASAPADPPAPTGMVFSHWSETADGPAFDFTTAINSDLTLYATWKELHTVTFYVDAETEWRQDVVDGSAVAQPQDPAAPEGKRFAGWTLNDAAYDFNTLVMGDIRLVASFEDIVYHTVTFMNGTEQSQVQVEDGTAAAAPSPSPEAPEGEVFLYWATYDGTDYTQYDFNSAVTGNLTLYAVFGEYQPIYYTVTFTVDGTSYGEGQSVLENTQATKPADPSYQGNRVFSHWALNGTPYDFSTPVTADIELTAVSEACVTITFETYLWDHDQYTAVDIPAGRIPTTVREFGEDRADVTGLAAQTNTAVQGLAFDLKVYDAPHEAMASREVIGTYTTTTPGEIKIPISQIQSAIRRRHFAFDEYIVLDIDPVVTSLATYYNGTENETTTFDWDWATMNEFGAAGLTGVRVIPRGSVVDSNGTTHYTWEGRNKNDVIWLKESDGAWVNGFSFTFKSWVVPSYSVTFETLDTTYASGEFPGVDGTIFPAPAENLFPVQKFKPVNSIGQGYGYATNPGNPTPIDDPEQGHINMNFLGWFEVLADGTLAESSFNFNTPIKYSRTLRARYGEAPVEVKWVVRAEDTDNNKEVTVYSKNEGIGTKPVYDNWNTATPPSLIVPTGKSEDADYIYEFVGWTDDANGQVAKWAIDGSPEQAITGPTTYYAVFTQIEKPKVFYVVHSGIDNAEANKLVLNLSDYPTYDLTADLTPGTLYGGYYLGTDGSVTTSVEAYDGDNWTWANPAMDEKGTQITPVRDETYYIKEVPAGRFLKPYTHFSYYMTTYDISDVLMISDLDDYFYLETGFAIVSEDGKVAKLCKSLTVKNKIGGTTKVLTPQSVFGKVGATANDYLSYLEVKASRTFQNGDKIYVYWKTPDGLYVTGTTARTLTGIGNVRTIKGVDAAVASTIGESVTID